MMKYFLLSILVFLLYRSFFPSKALNDKTKPPLDKKSTNKGNENDYIDYEEID